MDVCKTCGNSEFTLWDGFYFCAECQTQSQNLREEKEENDEKGNFFSTSLKINTIKTTNNKKKDNDYSYKWTTTEAFNIIMKKTVDILIENGATCKLKETVLNLWCYYLRKSQRAFCSKSGDEWTPRLEVKPRERDEQIIYGNRTELICTKWLKNSKKYRTSRKNQTKKSRNQTLRGILNNKSKEESINQVHSSSKKKANLSNEIEDSNQPNEMSEDEDDLVKPIHSSTPRRKMYSKDARKAKKAESKIGFNSSRLSLLRILEFLYLGLLLTRDKILLCDLLRLIECNVIPLCGAHNLLPEFMTFQTYDISTFTLKVTPSYESVRKRTTKLAQYLKIDSLPKKCLQSIVGRFILELNLPRELQQMIHRLIIFCPPKLNLKITSKNCVYSIPNYEGRALGFIFVALKLLLGFDGETERKQSQFSKKLSELIKDLKPFIWEDWMAFIKLRKHLVQQFIITKHLNNPGTYPFVDELIKFYMVDKNRLKGRLTKKKAKKKYYREDMGLNIRYPLENVMDTLPASDNQPVFMGSFPESYAATQVMINGSNNFSELNANFGDSVICHLLNPEILNTQLSELNVKLIIKGKKSGPNSKKIKNKKTMCKKNLSDKEYNKNLLEVDSVLDSSLEATVCSMTMPSNGPSTAEQTAENSKISKLIVRQPFRHYAFNDYKKKMNNIQEVYQKLPQSAQWLLNLLSDTGQMKPATIFQEVVLIEKVLFCTSKCMTKHRLAISAFMRLW